MTLPEMTALNQIFPIIIERYERFIPNIEGMDTTSKINAIIQYLNRIGKISNYVVDNWNLVMKWVLDEGLTEAVNAKVDDLIAKGLFDDLLNQSLDNLNTVVDDFKTTVNTQLDGFETSLISYSINVKKPLVEGLAAAVGDGVTDDYNAIKAIIDYAIANNLKVVFPTANYLLSQPLSFDDNIHLTLEGGDKENCKLTFTSSSGVWFKRGVVRMSNFQITTPIENQTIFKALQLGDTIVSDPNDSLHWSKFSHLKLCGNQGIGIGNFFDSSLDDIDIIYLSGTNPTGVNFLQGANTAYCASNNLVSNRLHVESTTDDGILLNFNQGSSATANFVFNGCHFESHRQKSNSIVINGASNITFISCQISHSGTTGETVETHFKDTFIFNNALGIKFIACGIGGAFVTSAPVTNTARLMKLMGTTRFISFDNCMISPPFQGGTPQGSWLFNVDAGFTGEYPSFENCMYGDATHTFDRLILGFNSMGAFNNKMYMGMGSDFGLHVNSGKWNLSSTPDDPNNYGAFSTFMQNGMFKTAGVMGRHSGTLTANGGIKVIAYNGRSGNLNSGLYIVNVLTAGGNAYTSLISYNAFTNTVTTVFLGSVFSTVKDTASKINVYGNAGQINIQNLLTQDVTYSIVPFFIS